MKESKYNFFLSDNENNIHLIYNAFRNTLISDQEEKFHNLIKQCGRHIHFNPEYIKKEEFNDLVSSGIIVSDTMNEKQITIDKNKKQLEILHQKNDILSLVITPTLRCNFKCFYCFENVNIRKNDDSINIETQNDIINFIEKSIIENQIKTVKITWYGGEPLIQQKIIFIMQRKINELCIFHNIKSYSTIVTNGILLSQETCTLLFEHGIRRVQVTIDGPEHIHNKRRYYPVNPSNNYNQILENILNANHNIRFQIRINIDKTNKDVIFDLIDDLIKRKIWPHKKNVTLSTAQVESANQTDLSKEEFYVLQDRIRYYMMRKYSEINPHQADKVKLNFFYPKLGIKVGCGYGVFRNSWVISYNGDVFRCWESIGQKENKVGTMKDLLKDFGRSIFDKIKLDNQTFENWGCFDCKFFPICKSICPWDFIKGRRCTEWKSILEYRILNQYKLWLKQPEIFKNTPFNVS